MDRFKVPVQDDGDQEAVALRRDKCGPPRVKRKRTVSAGVRLPADRKVVVGPEGIPRTSSV